MNRIILLAALVAGLVTVGGTTSNAQEITEPSYVQDWCRDVGASLRRALATGTQTSTYGEEKSILLFGINQALNTTNEKKQPFLRYTLGAALADLPIFEKDEGRQVAHLRSSI